MAGEARESRLAIVIDSGDAEQRIKELRKQLRELGQQSDETGDNTDDLGRRQRRASDDAGNLGSANDRAKKSLDNMAIAAAAAGIALAGAIGLSINKAQSWETAMAEINKTVNFAADDGLANLRKGLQELTTQIPQTFEELAAVTATGGQLGIAEKDLLRFTEVMAKMGVAFDIPAQQAADSMAKIANVFQIPIANIDRLGDAINTLSNNTPATAAQLIDSLQRVGGVAKVFGLSEDATLGLTGALIAMGKPAEVASTAVNSLLTTFSTLDNATKSQYIGFEQLGLNIDEFSQLVKTDGKQAIITYLEAINKLEQSERIGTNALIVGKEFGDDITMLAGSIGVLEKNWAMLGETAGTTKEYFGSMDSEFVKISATSANKMQLFKNNIDGVVAGIGGAFIPALNDLLLNMTPLIATLSIWVSENPELIQQIAVIGGGLAATAVSLKLAVDGFIAAKATVDGLKLAYAALGSTMGLTVLGLGILLAAGVLVYQNWDTIKKIVSENQGVFIALGVSVIALSVALIAANAPLILLKVQAAAAAIQAGVMAVATAGWSVAAGVAAAATWVFNAALAVLTSPILLVVAGIAALIAIGYLVYQNWDMLVGKANEFADVIVNGVVDAFNSAVDAANEFADNLVGSVVDGFNGAIQAAKGFVSSLLAGIKSGFGRAVDSAVKAWTDLVAKTKAKFNDIKTTIVSALTELPARLLQIGRDIVNGLVNGIKSGVSRVANAMRDMASSAVSAAKNVLDINSPSKVMRKIGDAGIAGGLAQGIKKGKKAVVSEAQKMAEEAIKATQDGISSMQRELDLFGNSSKLLEVTYDIEIVGKYGGNTNALQSLASQLDDKKIKDNGDKLLSGLKRDFELLGETRPFVQWRNDFEDINNELSKMDDTLKLNILDAVTALDFKKQGLAIASANEDIDKQIMLLGAVNDLHKQSLAIDYEHNELMKGFEYMQQLGFTTAYESLKLDAEKLKAAKEHLVLITARKTATDAVTNSTDALNKQIALFGNDSPFAELNYDLEFTDKYLNASTQSVIDLQKAMQALTALNTEKAFKGVLDANAGDKSPIGKIMQEYDDKMAIIKAYEDSHTALLQESVAARLEVEGAYNDARSIMMLSSGEAVFGSLSGLAKNFLGEQSGTYKAMYALQKAFTLSSAIMSSKKAVMDAWANTPGGVWAKAFAAGKVILSTGAITKAIAGLAPQGFKAGGYTGNMGINQVAGEVHGQEYVFDAQATKRIGVDNLNAMRSGKAPQGGDVQVNIINNSSARVQASDDGKTITISDVRNEARNEAKRAFSNLQNPNSHESKMVNRNVQAPRRR